MFDGMNNLNSVVDSIEVNNESGIDNRAVSETLIENSGNGRVSVDVVGVLGEGSGTSNICGSGKVDLGGEMGAVDREESLKAEITRGNMESVVEQTNLENKEDFGGEETERCNGKLGMELKRVGNGDVEAIVERDQNQGMGVNVLPQHVQAGENVGINVDSDSSHHLNGDAISGCVNNGAGGSEYLIKSNLPVSDGVVDIMGPIWKADQNVNPNVLTEDKRINGSTEDLKGKDVRKGVLIPRVRGKENQTEKEGEFYVSDLVWGKVRSHPWWPGQIFEPSAATKKAMKYFKKDSYLIAYFGDQSFAWNEASKIRPFGMYFSEMEKQSNSESFNCAVDEVLGEVSRRIESRLACRCLQPASVPQLVARAGRHEQSNSRFREDGFPKADSLSPEKLVNYIELLAKAPNTAIDRLEFVMARAQFLAFNRWKGYREQSVFQDFDGISENEADPTGVQANSMMQGEGGQVLSGKAKPSTQDGSRKQKRVTADDQGKKRTKHIMELVQGGSSASLNGENKNEGKACRKLPLGSTRQKRKAVDVIDESGAKRRKGHSLESAKNKASSLPQIEVREGSTPSLEASNVDKSAFEDGGKPVNIYASGVSTLDIGDSFSGSLSLGEYPPTDEMLSNLVFAAKNHVEGYSSLILVAGFFSDFRNSICVEYNDPEKKKNSSGALKLLGMEEDSYWTDIFIESTPDEQVIFEYETNAEKVNVVAEPESVDISNPIAVNDHEKHAIVADDLDVEDPSAPIMGEKSNEESPTALTLNFNNLDSVPPIPNLNEIFSRYGPLFESETQILSKSKGGKVVVVFKRRRDAETAFSSTGKFSIFGFSLVSYRLKYLPAQRKAASKTKGKRKKSTSAEEEGCSKKKKKKKEA